MFRSFDLLSVPGFPSSRRSFLRIGAAGLAGLTLGEALRAEDQSATPAAASPPARNVIMLFLTGGPATIDMWDMKPEAPASIRGEFRPIDTSVGGLQICEHMSRLAKGMHLAALVRSVTHTIAEHTQGQRYVMTGNAPSPAVESASLGSLASHLIRDRRGVPAYATLGDVPAANSGDLGAAFNPFSIPSLERTGPETSEDGGKEARGGERIGLPAGFTRDDLVRRLRIRDRLDQRMAGGAPADLAGQLDRFHAEAVEILRSDAIKGALQIGQETAAVRELYGESDLGRRALAARRLVEAGARFVTIGFGDWDTHANNFARLQQSLLPQLDRALAALLTDLEERGLLRETIVYCTGEFGRTPAVNGNAGRDHWARTMTALVAGGGFRRGYVHGATDEEGVEPTSRGCSPDDLSATIFRQLGFGPGHLAMTRTGRPIRIFPAGVPVEGLVEAGV